MSFLRVLQRSWFRASAQAFDARWVVVDLETSGLMKQTDEVLSIGAVALRNGVIQLDDAFEITLKPKNLSTKENILVHGIGRRVQRNGLDPASACRDFLDYVGQSPLIAFHAAFDQGFLARAMKVYLGMTSNLQWLDVAEIAKALHPEVNAKALDDWLEHFSIESDQRHNALNDAFVTAMLLQKIVGRSKELGKDAKRFSDFRRLQSLASASRWLN